MQMDNLQITNTDILQYYGEAMENETGEPIKLFAISFEDFKITHDSRTQETKITMYDFRVMHEPGSDEVTIRKYYSKFHKGNKWFLHHMKSWDAMQ